MATNNNRQKALDKIFGLWERYAPRYKDSFGSLSFYKDFGDTMEKALIPGSGGIILDAGCGDGGQFKRFMRTLRPEKIVGLDYSPTMLKEAEKTRRGLQKKYRLYRWLNQSRWTRWLTGLISEWRFYGCEIELVQADLCKKIPYSDNTFDVVVLHLVGYYLPFNSWENTTSKEVFRVTKPKGYIVTTDAIRQWNFRREIAGLAFVKETIKHPLGMLWTALVARPVLVQFQDLANEGVLNYLSPEERKATLETVGCEKIEICGRSKFLKGQFVTIRGFKPG